MTFESSSQAEAGDRPMSSADTAARAELSDGLLTALDAYVSADETAGRKTRAALGLGENDLRALQFILASHAAGGCPSAKAIADHLGISTASTTVLLDRLEAAGHIRRRRNPSDRRAIEIEPTSGADARMRLLLNGVHARRLAAVDQLSHADALTIRSFLEEIRRAVEE